VPDNDTLLAFFEKLKKLDSFKLFNANKGFDFCFSIPFSPKEETKFMIELGKIAKEKNFTIEVMDYESMTVNLSIHRFQNKIVLFSFAYKFANPRKMSGLFDSFFNTCRLKIISENYKYDFIFEVKSEDESKIMEKLERFKKRNQGLIVNLTEY